MTKHRADRADMIVSTIADFRLTYGYGPTVRELRDRVDLASTSAVWHHLTKLQREGRVTWTEGLTRTLAVSAPLVATEPGICTRPGCGKAIPPRKRRGRTDRLWCSPSCGAIGNHVRHWLRASNAEDVAERIGLPL